MKNDELQTIEIKPLANFETSKAELAVFVADYKNLIVTPDTFEESKKARLALRDRRFSIQKIEKENTDKLNDLKNQNWANAKELIELIEPVENSIDAGIKKIEAEKAAIKAEKERIESERVAAELKAEQERIAEMERQRIAAIEAQQKVEAERLAKLQAEIDAKNKAEEERLAAIKVEQDKREAEIKADQEKERADQEAKEKALRAEREKFEADKRAQEEKLQREEDDRKRAIELETAKKEAAENALKEADEKTKREAAEKAEREKLAKEKAIAKEARQPDKKKLQQFAVSLPTIGSLELKSDEAKQIQKDVQDLLNKVVVFITSKCEAL